MKLSDEELAKLRRLFVRDMLDADEVEANADKLLAVIAELRSLRALLAMEMPCGWPEPSAVPNRYATARNVVRWDVLESDQNQIDPDEAIALGAALIRAALQARGEK